MREYNAHTQWAKPLKKKIHFRIRKKNKIFRQIDISMFSRGFSSLCCGDGRQVCEKIEFFSRNLYIQSQTLYLQCCFGCAPSRETFFWSINMYRKLQYLNAKPGLSSYVKILKTSWKWYTQSQLRQELKQTKNHTKNLKRFMYYFCR